MSPDTANQDPDPSDTSSDDDSGNSDDGHWADLTILAVSILASALLHFAGIGGIHYIAHLAFGLEADIQWTDTADELRGLGHRIDDRYAELGDEPSADSEDDQNEPPPPSKGPELDEDELKKALDGSYEPPDVPDPPEPDPDAPPSAESTPRESSESDDPAPDRSSDDASDGSSSSETGDRDRSAFSEIGDHQALDRGGPTDLPDMRSFAPGNARMSAFIRVDQIRDQPYEKIVKKILRAVPDYRLLLGSPEIDPIRDMDWFFMASPDPRYIQNTFLAVRHQLPNERLVDLLDGRYPNSPPWETYEDFPVRDLVPENPHYRDPRRILLAGDGLTLVAKRELLGQIAGPLAEESELLKHSGAPDGSEPADRNPDATEPSRPTLIDGLARLHHVARRDDTIVLMSARGLTFSMPGVGRLPHFESVRLAVTRPERPTLDIDLQFKDERRAQEFERRCPALRKAIDDAIPFSRTLGVSSMLQALECRADGAYVNVHGEFTVEEVAKMGDFALPFVPHPPVLEQLPEPPREEETMDDGPDTGTTRDSKPDTGQEPEAP